MANPDEAPGDDVVRIRRVRVRDEAGETTPVVDIRKPFGIELIYEVLEDHHALAPVIEFYNEAGTELFSTHDATSRWRRLERPRATYTSTVWVPGNLLAEGSLIVPQSSCLISPRPSCTLTSAMPSRFRLLTARRGFRARRLHWANARRDSSLAELDHRNRAATELRRRGERETAELK